MKTLPNSGWWIPAGLLLLSILPLFGAAHRLTELISDVEITNDNARFFASPQPITLHIVSSVLYFVLGAFQFSHGFRRNHPGWHRVAGRILIPAGLLCAASGMWMAVFYPPLFGSGQAITYIRLLVGSATVVFICLGFAAIRQRSFLDHRAWMMRAYALAIAAGTQPLTLGIVFLIFGAFAEMEYTLGLTAGWLVNLLVAEWIIRRRRDLEGVGIFRQSASRSAISRSRSSCAKN